MQLAKRDRRADRVLREPDPHEDAAAGAARSSPASSARWDRSRSCAPRKSTAVRTARGSGIRRSRVAACCPTWAATASRCRWYLLTPPGKSPTFLVPQSVTRARAPAQVGSAALARRAAANARRRLRRNAGRGLRDRAGHVSQPGNEPARARRSSPCRGCTTSRACGCWSTASARVTRSKRTACARRSRCSSATRPLRVVADAELALEKSTASQGLLAVQPNEPDLYGYVDENVDARACVPTGRPALLDSAYGLEIVRLTMAAYLSAEQGRAVDLTDPATDKRLATYVPAIQQGRGGAQLLGVGKQ